MHCSRCLTEYREGFLRCSDCREALVPGPAPHANAAADPDVELAAVFETGDALLLSLAASTLREAGIEFEQFGEVYLAGGRPTYMPEWFGNTALLKVRQADEAEARTLLALALEPQPPLTSL